MQHPWLQYDRRTGYPSGHTSTPDKNVLLSQVLVSKVGDDSKMNIRETKLLDINVHWLVVLANLDI